MDIEIKRAARLRKAGYYYHEIDHILGWYRGRCWQVLNRHTKNQIDHESGQRYRARGGVALCDLSEDGGH